MIINPVYIPKENVMDVIGELGGNLLMARGSTFKVMFGSYENRSKRPAFELTGRAMLIHGRRRCFVNDLNVATHIRFETYTIANLHGYGKGSRAAIREFAKVLFQKMGCVIEHDDIVTRDHMPVEASKCSFTPEEVAQARQYWKGLSDEVLRSFHRHYTTGRGKGTFAGTDETTSFEDYLVISARQTEYERQHDI